MHSYTPRLTRILILPAGFPKVSPPPVPHDFSEGNKINMHVSLKQCTIYLTAKKFPYLIMSKLTPDETSRLIAKLEGETRTIELRFANLVATVGQALERSHATADKLKLFLDSCGMKELADCINSSEVITEAIRKISRGHYWSFFNYELFEIMTTTFCKSKDVISHLDSYKSDFRVYCMRRLFEMPAIVFEKAIPDSDSVLKFYIKIDSNFTVSVNDIKNIQHLISKMLDVHPLYLIDVKDGCVELHFGCLKSMQELFPHDGHEKMRKSLAQLQAVEYLQCGDMKIALAQTDLPETTIENEGPAELSDEELPGSYIRICTQLKW